MGENARITFDSLPLQPHHPKCSAWGKWGVDDQLGTLNYLTGDVVAQAASEIRTGAVIPLNLPLNIPLVPMNPARKPITHTILAKGVAPGGYANDDELHINTQSSSQWDGLRHYPYQDNSAYGEGRFYGGARQADLVDENGPTPKLGIQNMANRGIVSRGVLLDWRSYAVRNGIKYSPFESHAIPLHELQAVAKEEGITFRKGDILLIRSGWVEEYLRLSHEERIALADRRGEHRQFAGVEASKEMLQWHWDNQFAAVAGDTNAYEAWPSNKPCGVSCHEVFLGGWGMPIGELWDLEELAKVCEREQRWTFMLTSSPLNVIGGVASPPNALAIF